MCHDQGLTANSAYTAPRRPRGHKTRGSYHGAFRASGVSPLLRGGFLIRKTWCPDCTCCADVTVRSSLVPMRPAQGMLTSALPRRIGPTAQLGPDAPVLQDPRAAGLMRTSRRRLRGPNTASCRLTREDTFSRPKRPGARLRGWSAPAGRVAGQNGERSARRWGAARGDLVVGCLPSANTCVSMSVGGGAVHA